jgi:hypothetical protein
MFKTIAQTSSSGDAYVELCTAWTPSVVPAYKRYSQSWTNSQSNLTIGTGNYIFNQDVTDQTQMRQIIIYR